MSNFDIGIIGGTGAMGQWFAEFFRDNGYRVHVTGRRTGLAFKDLATHCAVVIISVPIGVTCETIAQIGPWMNEDALLMDLTSLKTEPVQAMLKASPSEVIGLHPLFGPHVPSLKGQNIAICPGRGEKWLPWLKGILEKNGAHIVETSPEKHDDMMSLIQGLNHLNTAMMGLALKNANRDPAELDRYSTPAFRTKMDLIGKIFEDNPGMYAEIIALNPHIENILKIYETNLFSVKELILNRDILGLASLFGGK